ncbi:flagellar hook assembly protein FlgD [Fontimonas sp. SYSU GA230001]|uniref:flagellar hook assembly protein FlgD n=1 Tax=Fontimonas sp. SYSU GA230001 TaxID=3142450 RepID=UPI0032B5369A
MAATGAVDSTYADLGLTLQSPSAKKQLGQEDFLKLMTAQLKNQDPFKPMENGEFLSQIAQFTTVSGIQDMQRSFANLASSLSANQTLQAAGLVGRSVLVPSDTGYLAADGYLLGGAQLPASGQLLVDIVDAGGQVVRTMDFGTQPAGTARFAWDGRDAGGQVLAEGSYGLRARLVQGSSQQAVATLAVGQVASVVLQNGGITLDLLGLSPVGLSDVQQIL